SRFAVRGSRFAVRGSRFASSRVRGIRSAGAGVRNRGQRRGDGVSFYCWRVRLRNRVPDPAERIRHGRESLLERREIPITSPKLGAFQIRALEADLDAAPGTIESIVRGGVAETVS